MLDLGIYLQSQGDPGAVEYFRKAALKKNVMPGLYFPSTIEGRESCAWQQKRKEWHCRCAPRSELKRRKAFAYMADVFEQGRWSIYAADNTRFWRESMRGLLGIPRNPEEATKLRNFGPLAMDVMGSSHWLVLRTLQGPSMHKNHPKWFHWPPASNAGFRQSCRVGFSSA